MIIERDNADEFGMMLVDELITAVDDIIYDKYIERQLVPYTLHKLFNQVLHAVDVRTASVLHPCTCTYVLRERRAHALSQLGGGKTFLPENNISMTK